MEKLDGFWETALKHLIWVLFWGVLVCLYGSQVYAQDETYHPLGSWKLVTSDYGWRNNPIRNRGREFHRGIDIDCEVGDSVYAWRSGTILYTGYNKLSGNMINVQHENGYLSKYHHLYRILVKEGQYVLAGQLIGLAGKSGRVTGSHLHFSLMRNNQHLDPLPYIKKARRVTTPPPDQPKKVPIFKHLVIRSFPIDGEVYINGEHRGNTPIDVKLAYGEHFVEIETGGKFKRFIGRLWINQNFGHLYVADLTQPAEY